LRGRERAVLVVLHHPDHGLQGERVARRRRVGQRLCDLRFGLLDAAQPQEMFGALSEAGLAHCADGQSFALVCGEPRDAGIGQRRVVQRPLHRIHRSDEHPDRGRFGDSGSEHLAAGQRLLLHRRQHFRAHLAFEDRELCRFASHRNKELRSFDCRVQVRGADAELPREPGDDVSRAAAFGQVDPGGRRLLEEFDEGVICRLAEQQFGVLVDPDEVLGLEEYGRAAGGAGAKAVAAAQVGIESGDREPRGRRSVLDFDLPLKGNDSAYNGRTETRLLRRVAWRAADYYCCRYCYDDKRQGEPASPGRTPLQPEPL
jgi:hypothetical protein